MQQFLSNNRDELISRCKAKVARRAFREATEGQLADGIPLFLDQLIRTLAAEDDGEVEVGLSISGPSGGDALELSQIGVGATAHGRQLLALGYTVNQVVHDYGDLCQAITDLAAERDAPFSIDSFRTLNRCLDNAIADAVSEFAVRRDALVANKSSEAENERLGFFSHELRNYLHVAIMAFNAIESGRLSIAGSTGSMLKRSLHRLDALIGQTLADVRHAAHTHTPSHLFSVADFVGDAAVIAKLYATDTGCTLLVPEVDPELAIRASRDLLGAALSNLLQNAFKFTAKCSQVTLRAYATDGRVLIEVHDQCGGLRPGAAEKMFRPFTQAIDDKRGLGLGLSIAAQSVNASAGQLRVQDVPGHGCIFTIDLPAETFE